MKNPSRRWTRKERLDTIEAILEEQVPSQGYGLNCDLSELPASKIRDIGERIFFLASKRPELLERCREGILEGNLKY